MTTRDFDFSILVSILNRILKDKEFKKKLHFIVDRQINDWEKWLQIELALFLTSKKYNVIREVTAYLDPEIYPNSKLSKIDMIIQKPKYEFDDYLFIELKCTKSHTALKRGLRNDWKKLNSIVKCDYKMKNSFLIGFHLFCKDDAINEMNSYVTEKLHGSYAVFKICQCRANTKCNCRNNQIGVVLC